MKIKKFGLPLLLVCAALTLTLRLFAKSSTTPAAAKPVANNASNEAIDAYLEEQMQRLNIPGGALAIVEGDQIVHLHSFGRTGPGGAAPTPQTPFVLGSTTKSFTALAVMQLVEAGKIDLDAPVQHFLPWFRVADPQASTQITVRHLLNQTSGISTAAGWIPLGNINDRFVTTERQVRALSTLKLARPVGSAFEYSNANYDILGLIIEAVSGDSYADYIRNHIFIPLGMRNSYTTQTEAKQNGLAVGHQYWFWSPVAIPNLPLASASLPSGQLISSAEDMARYLIAHLNGGRSGSDQILSSAGMDELHRGAAEFSEMGISVGQYGMGWFITGTGSAKTIWHTGNVPDFSSYMAIIPAQKKGLVLLINADHFMMTPILSEVGGGAAALLAGQQPAAGPVDFTRILPWMMRALLLIPLLQIAGLATTLWRLRGWRQDPQRRPSQARMWGLHILLPLVPNLSLAALAVYLLISKMRGFMLLFLPDFTWIGLICGSFAGIWSLLRTGLILRTLRKPSASKTQMGQFSANNGMPH